jgi:hypothetical protein
MKKPVKKAGKKAGKKIRKSDFEEKFALMVGEYNQAKEVLDSMTEGTSEYVNQKKRCDSLFGRAERFINTNS